MSTTPSRTNSPNRTTVKSILLGSLLANFYLAVFTVADGNAQQNHAFTAQNDTAAGVEAGPKNPYAPYEFLIGEWDVTSEDGGPAVAVQRVHWRSNRSYLWYAGSLIIYGREVPHCEGVIMWNGVHKNLDMLLSMDLRSGLVQEHGTLSVEPDGTVVRNVTGVYSEGAQPLGLPVAGPSGLMARFRQTFKAAGPDKIFTSVMPPVRTGLGANLPWQ
jgi:hypothetical protein